MQIKRERRRRRRRERERKSEWVKVDEEWREKIVNDPLELLVVSRVREREEEEKRVTFFSILSLSLSLFQLLSPFSSIFQERGRERNS